MKKLSRFILVCFLILGSSSAFSQKAQKFGHIDFQALLQILPERNDAKAELEQYAQNLRDQSEAMEVEYNKKLEDYKNTVETLAKSIREIKEAELQEMMNRIQQFQMNANKDLQDKESELFKPLMDKAQNAIKEVAKENGFFYVFEKNSLLYISEDSEDVMPLVKKKLGIQ